MSEITAKAASNKPTTPAAAAAAAPEKKEIRIPDNTTLQHAFKLALNEDKPIMSDYWVPSLQKGVFIGVKENKEKLLVKSEEEYTSPISKIFKVGGEYITMTENSIYIVDAGIANKRIS
jgi:hypothetical protein